MLIFGFIIKTVIPHFELLYFHRSDTTATNNLLHRKILCVYYSGAAFIKLDKTWQRFCKIKAMSN